MPLSRLSVDFPFHVETLIGSTVQVSPGPQGDRLGIGVTGRSFSGPSLEGTRLAGRARNVRHAGPMAA